MRLVEWVQANEGVLKETKRQVNGMQDNLDRKLGNERAWNDIRCAMRRDMHYIDRMGHWVDTSNEADELVENYRTFLQLVRREKRLNSEAVDLMMLVSLYQMINKVSHRRQIVATRTVSQIMVLANCWMLHHRLTSDALSASMFWSGSHPQWNTYPDFPPHEHSLRADSGVDMIQWVSHGKSLEKWSKPSRFRTRPRQLVRLMLATAKPMPVFMQHVALVVNRPSRRSGFNIRPSHWRPAVAHSNTSSPPLLIHSGLLHRTPRLTLDLPRRMLTDLTEARASPRDLRPSGRTGSQANSSTGKCGFGA